MRTVFVFEDEKTHRDKIVSLLEAEKYKVEASSKMNRALFDISSMQYAPDAAVLDIMDEQSSKTAGFQLFDKLRERWPTIPIIFLTAYEHGSKVKIQAIDLGAHWFINKRDDEEGAEVLAVLRKFFEPDFDETISFPPLTINLGKREVQWRGAIADIRDTPFEVLVAITSGTAVRPARYSDIADLAGIKTMEKSELYDDDSSDDGETKSPEYYRNRTVSRHKANICAALQDIENQYHESKNGSNESKLVIAKEVIGTKKGIGYFMLLESA